MNGQGMQYGQWAPLSIVLVFAVFILPRLYQGYSALMRRIYEDISTENAPPLPITLLIVNQLAELGFHRLGEIRFRWPNSPKELGKEWAFVQASPTVTAEVGAVTNTIPGVVFTTLFPDGSQVETGFPVGWNIKDPDYHSLTVVTSLDEAYRYHLAQTQEWQISHGAPDEISDMDSMLRMNQSRRLRFGPRKLKVLLWHYAPLMSIGIAGTIAWYAADWAKLAGAPSAVFYLILIGIPLGPILWTYWKLRSQQRAS